MKSIVLDSHYPAIERVLWQKRLLLKLGQIWADTAPFFGRFSSGFRVHRPSPRVVLLHLSHINRRLFADIIKVMKKFLLVSLIVASAIAASTGANAKSSYDAVVNFVALPNSEYDEEVNNREFIKMVAGALERAGVTPNFVKSKPRSKMWLQFSANYVRIPQSDARVINLISGVRNGADQELCSIYSGFWFRGVSGPQRLRKDVDINIERMVRDCVP